MAKWIGLWESAQIDDSLYFANAPDFTDEVCAGIEAYDDPRPQVVLVDGESINSIDATAIITLGELREELEQEGIKMWFARVRSNVMVIMERTEFVEAIGREHFFVSVQDGVDAFLAESQADDDA